MRHPFREESPCNVLHGTEFEDNTLYLLVMKDDDEFLEFACKKFLPRLLHIKEGLPLRAINQRKAAMNVCSEI